MNKGRQAVGAWEIYECIFVLVLEALREHGLLPGKDLWIDASVVEANVSLRALVPRNTEEQYWVYVNRLAAGLPLITTCVDEVLSMLRRLSERHAGCEHPSGTTISRRQRRSSENAKAAARLSARVVIPQPLRVKRTLEATLAAINPINGDVSA